MKNCSVFAILAALIVSANSFAQPNPPRPPRDGGPSGEGRRFARPPQEMMERSGFRGGERVFFDPVLNEEQRESLREAMRSQREKMRDLQEQIRKARQALMKQALTEDFKEEVVKAKAVEVAKLEAEVAVLRLKALAEVEPALSEEQMERILNLQPARSEEMDREDARPRRQRMQRPPEDAPRRPARAN